MVCLENNAKRESLEMLRENCYFAPKKPMSWMQNSRDLAGEAILAKADVAKMARNIG